VAGALLLALGVVVPPPPPPPELAQPVNTRPAAASNKIAKIIPIFFINSFLNVVFDPHTGAGFNSLF
jgi:hypothetical protein